MGRLHEPPATTQVTVVKALDAASIDGLEMNGSTKVLTIEANGNTGGGWVLANEVLGSDGKAFHPTVGTGNACGPSGGGRDECFAWVLAQHPQQKITYIPKSRFWALQWYETAIYLALALVLAGFCVWWVRRRVS